MEHILAGRLENRLTGKSFIRKKPIVFVGESPRLCLPTHEIDSLTAVKVCAAFDPGGEYRREHPELGVDPELSVMDEKCRILYFYLHWAQLVFYFSGHPLAFTKPAFRASASVQNQLSPR